MSSPHDAAPTRLDRAITWTGVGAATAWAAVLLMYGAQMLALSEPSADNVGEEGIAAGLGVIGWGAGLIVALVAGWRLARRAPRRRWLLRALPLLVGITWTLLARAALYGRWLDGAVSDAFGAFDQLPPALSLALWPLYVQSAYSVGALPVCIGLIIAFLVLIVVRTMKRTPDQFAAVPTA